MAGGGGYSNRGEGESPSKSIQVERAENIKRHFFYTIGKWFQLIAGGAECS